MISIEKLKVRFGNQTVLDDISINFSPALVHGIVGLNGAGKTTFFNTLTHAVRPDSGKISWNGESLKKSDTGYLETVNFFYSKITGGEYLKIFKQTNSNFNLDALQELFKLPLDQLIETYSTGMKKKLALLGILKQDKPIYLLDEPFNGLDLETSKVLELIIQAIQKKDKTVFVSSHIIDTLLSVCNEIHVLENGQFKKSYAKNDFHCIENELFGKLKDHARTIISNSI